jgi:hypothetical protein
LITFFHLPIPNSEEPDFEEIYHTLRSVAERERRDPLEEYGAVQFAVDERSNDTLHFVYHRQLLRRLLDTAFENRLEPETSVESDAMDTLNEIWISDSEAP